MTTATPTSPISLKTENTDLTLILAISIPTVLVLLMTIAVVIWLWKKSILNTPTIEGVDQCPVYGTYYFDNGDEKVDEGVIEVKDGNELYGS